MMVAHAIAPARYDVFSKYHSAFGAQLLTRGNRSRQLSHLILKIDFINRGIHQLDLTHHMMNLDAINGIFLT